MCGSHILTQYIRFVDKLSTTCQPQKPNTGWWRRRWFGIDERWEVNNELWGSIEYNLMLCLPMRSTNWFDSYARVFTRCFLFRCVRVAKKSAVCACVKDTYIYLSDIGEKSSSFLELLIALFFFVCDLLTESIALSTNQVEKGSKSMVLFHVVALVFSIN